MLSSYASRSGLCLEGLARTALPVSSASFVCFCVAQLVLQKLMGTITELWTLEHYSYCCHVFPIWTCAGQGWAVLGSFDLAASPVIYTQQRHHFITELFCYSTVGGCGSFLSSCLLKLLVFLFCCVLVKLLVMSMFGVLLQMLAFPKGVGTTKRRNLKSL